MHDRNVSGCNISGTVSLRGWGASAISQTSVRLMKLEPDGVVMATRHASPPRKSQGKSDPRLYDLAI